MQNLGVYDAHHPFGVTLNVCEHREYFVEILAQNALRPDYGHRTLGIFQPGDPQTILFVKKCPRLGGACWIFPGGHRPSSVADTPP